MIQENKARSPLFVLLSLSFIRGLVQSVKSVSEVFDIFLFFESVITGTYLTILRLFLLDTPICGLSIHETLACCILHHESERVILDDVFFRVSIVVELIVARVLVL